MEYFITEVKPKDSEALYRLNVQLGYSYDMENTRRRLEAILSAGRDRLWLAVDRDTKAPAGYIHITPYNCTFDDDLYDIRALVVDHKWRGTGLGKALVKHGEEWARSRQGAGMRLISGVDRLSAHDFYRAMGYTEGKGKKYFQKKF